MIRKAMVGGVLAAALAAPAFASECDPTQAQEGGKLAGSLVKAKISEVVPVEGKLFVNVSTCEVRAGKYYVDLRFNFTGASGLYWLEGAVVVDSSGAGELKSRRASDNLKAAAETKGSLLLASR